MKSESVAIRRFERFGRESLELILARIFERANKRMKEIINYNASADCWISSNTAHQWLTDSEKAVVLTIQNALILCTDPAGEAKERNRLRVLERRKRKAKKQS